MNPDGPPFSADIITPLMNFNDDECAFAASLGAYYPADLMDLCPTFSSIDPFQTLVDPFTFPGVPYSPSLPPSPLSSADDLSDLGGMDALSLYPNHSLTELTILSPLVNTEAVKAAKPDLENFDYDLLTSKWVCAKCKGDFVSTHEARRHVKTAAKCTGKKVKCLRCDDDIHAAPWSRKRHFGSKKCQKKGRKRGAPTYTLNNAFKDL